MAADIKPIMSLHLTRIIDCCFFSVFFLVLFIKLTTEPDVNSSAKAQVEFTATAVSVLESGKTVQLGLVRSVNTSKKVTVR